MFRTKAGKETPEPMNLTGNHFQDNEQLPGNHAANPSHPSASSGDRPSRRFVSAFACTRHPPSFSTKPVLSCRSELPLWRTGQSTAFSGAEFASERRPPFRAGGGSTPGHRSRRYLRREGSAMTPFWRLEMLGGLRLRRGEQTLTRFRTQKTGGLLAYLMYYGERAYSREILCEMFWPEAEQGAARHNRR
jgi:hypothetical protein